MENCVVIVICALCFVFHRTMTAPIIKASGVQWSEPKGTGKGNITLIMIPQNNSCGNDSDMIVAVKSDYQIMSQDTQLLNLVVNENTVNKTNDLRCDTSFKKASIMDNITNNQEQEKMLIHPNTAKYFEPENKLASENNTNNTVNIHPLLVKNYQDLVVLNGTSTTLSSNTINVLQLLNMTASNNESGSLNSVNVLSDSHLNTATSKYNSLNLTVPNNQSIIQDNVVKSKNDNISLSIVGSDDNFLNEALNILEKLKQDPSYYNKLKSNQIPSTEEIKENGDISLSDSKPKFLKADDSALASDEGEGLVHEFRHINHENQDISNIEGNINENIPTSTCLPFFMSLNSDQTTTQLTDLNSSKEILFEKVPLKGTGSNVSQELIINDNSTSSYKNLSLTSNCKSLVPNNGFGEPSQTTVPPIQSYINVSVGYGVQSNGSSQTLSVKSCKPSNGLNTESTNVIPLTITTSKTEYGVGAAENITSVSKGEPNFLQQTLAAAKVAAGSELNITDSTIGVAVTSMSVSGSESYFSINQTECVTSSSGSLVPSKLEQVNKAPSAGEYNSSNISDNQTVNISHDNPVTIINQNDKSLIPRPAVSLDGSVSQNLPRLNGFEIKTTECVSSDLLQTISPIVVSTTSTNNVAAGFNSMPGIQTVCVTDPNVNVKQELGLPQAGVGAVPKKITLEPQISCGITKKVDSSSTSCPTEGQEARLNDKDLTLPLVKSSIFLANNNEMPKGKDIPISLNASIDEFSLSDLQGKEDRMHGKVAELYNRNPLLFNVDRETTGALLKPRLKFYKSDISKNPSFYFDKTYNPYSNQLFKMNFAGKNVYLEKRPYKSETNDIIYKNNLGKNKQLITNELEPAKSDDINLKQELTTLINPQIIISTTSTVYTGIERKYMDTTIKLLDSHQPAANEEERLLTILNTLDQTTLGVKPDDTFLENDTVLGIRTISPNSNMAYTHIPANVDKVLYLQELGKNNTNEGGTLGQEDNENINIHRNSLITLTTNQPYLSRSPTGRLRGTICSKSYKSKTNEVKAVHDFFRTSSNDETVQDKSKHNKDKMSIPADSVQKIVIEIVRNTKKPRHNPERHNPDTETRKYDNKENVNSIGGNKDKNSFNAMENTKQNFVPFKSAWMPVQTKEKPSVFPLSDPSQLYSDYVNEQCRDSLKPEIYESGGIRNKNIQTQNDNKLFANQNVYKQAQIPTNINEYNSKEQSANNYKSLGTNTLQLLMADRSVAKNK